MHGYRAMVTLYSETADDVEVEVTVYDDSPRMAVERAGHAALHSITERMEPPEIAQMETTEPRHHYPVAGSM